MIVGTVYSEEVLLCNKFKPTFFLNEGKRIIAKMKRNGHVECQLSDMTRDVFRPGIFKRVFVSDSNFGVKYITAANMMASNPLDYAKLLSIKLTKDMKYMSLVNHGILISCAGTVGNIRLIDRKMDGIIGSQDIIRVIPYEDNYGFLYAYLSTSIIYQYIQSLIYGSVVSRIEPLTVKNIPVISISQKVKEDSHKLVVESARLREEAALELEQAQQKLKQYSGLRDLAVDDYDYYGPKNEKRVVSCFTVNRKDISTTTINAFNLSERIRKTKQQIPCKVMPLRDTLIGNTTFSTGSFSRIEVKDGCGIMLINQSDIFDTIVKGKNISKRKVKTDSLVEYGEVLIAGVGTLGENETFCRCIFANEDLVGQLVSGEFIRMKTNENIPSGFLFAWLSSDYGFRFIRNLQAGTKLCRPIPKLLLEVPVPVISKEKMQEIDSLVKTSHTKRYQANCNEREAISMVETEIEKWNKN